MAKRAPSHPIAVAKSPSNKQTTVASPRPSHLRAPFERTWVRAVGIARPRTGASASRVPRARSPPWSITGLTATRDSARAR